ncbi:hypothetical protein DFH06DRAFT_1122075 [Mycena polygramma]|nr:hypothetical protein DFH06DRAFT_1122075 [Mycena polygramma]
MREHIVSNEGEVVFKDQVHNETLKTSPEPSKRDTTELTAKETGITVNMHKVGGAASGKRKRNIPTIFSTPREALEPTEGRARMDARRSLRMKFATLTNERQTNNVLCSLMALFVFLMRAGGSDKHQMDSGPCRVSGLLDYTLEGIQALEEPFEERKMRLNSFGALKRQTVLQLKCQLADTARPYEPSKRINLVRGVGMQRLRIHPMQDQTKLRAGEVAAAEVAAADVQLVQESSSKNALMVPTPSSSFMDMDPENLALHAFPAALPPADSDELTGTPELGHFDVTPKLKRLTRTGGLTRDHPTVTLFEIIGGMALTVLLFATLVLRDRYSTGFVNALIFAYGLLAMDIIIMLRFPSIRLLVLVRGITFILLVFVALHRRR